MERENNKNVTIFWFRRDLRLKDNTALAAALAANTNVQPIFIFDKEILDDIETRADRRVSFIYETITALKKELHNLGSDLWVFHDAPEKVFERLVDKYLVDSIYFNHDYEPYAIKRDERIKMLAIRKNIPMYSFKDQVILEKLEVTKQNGEPYTVFTPYMKKWKELFNGLNLSSLSNENICQNLNKPTQNITLIELADLGFVRSNHLVEPVDLNSLKIEKYHDTRNDLGLENGTSRLSVHLRFGTISIREVVKFAMRYNETFLNELIWREFYMQILFNFPHVITENFKPIFNSIKWNSSTDDFKRWCNAETGYPIVDAAMNQLLDTGYMHNRARMIVASFLCKHLLIDWRKGEAFFARHLTDYELSSNNGGWQWAASTGCDAVPYFRIFNPYLQAEKFDKDGIYMNKWKANKAIKPMVDHDIARKRAIETYKYAKDTTLK